MTLEIQLEFYPKISYVIYQNGMNVALVANAENTGDELRDVTFTLSSEPRFFPDVVCKYDSIGTGQAVDLLFHEQFKLNLDAEKIADMTEGEDCRVTLAAESGGEEIGRAECDVRILPFNHWPGVEMPETTSAFITPNVPGITKIKSDASDILKSWGESSSLEGYQGDANRVLSMGAAVYAALERHNINYVNPPAGFETRGQRIRLPEEVLSGHEGTCIDLTALYASVLESIGLNTLVFFVKGHAFAGFWLTDDHSPDIISYDSAAFTRCIRNNEMRAVECTMFTSGSHRDFEAACDSALIRLEDSENFICTLDVRRSRSSVSPLPIRRSDSGSWVLNREEETVYTTRPESAIHVYEEEPEVRNLTKDDLWKRQLLDITTRNSLISMKQGTKIAPLLIGDISGFEDRLAEGRRFSLLSKPQEWDGENVFCAKPFETELYIGNYGPSYEDDVSMGRLRLPLTEGETEKRLRNIYRTANKELDESGCNCLFIAMGVLRWYEKPGSKTPRYAPLILIPAEIIKKQTGFQIKKLEEETVFNVTMMEKLRQEYEINIPIPDPLPAEEYGVNVDQILQTVRRNISGMEGWEVLKGAALGVFSFSQYAMWKDLDCNMEELSRNTVVDCFMKSSMYPAPEELEEDSDPYELCLTVPADSSQIIAVKAAGNGKTFIMHGPPGTGKSQTITNIITNSLYNGRTVLFVAEKAEALQVVQKRLNQVGIGNHCLELHSNKTEKSKVMEQLKKALDRTGTFSKEVQEQTYRRLKELGRKLDGYASALHTRQPWGLSLYDCISRYESHDTEGVSDIRTDNSILDGMDMDRLERVEDDIVSAFNAYENVRTVTNPALRSIRTTDRRMTLESDARRMLDEAAGSAEQLISLRNAMRSYGLPPDPSDLKGTQDYFGRVTSVHTEVLDIDADPETCASAEKYARTVKNVTGALSGLDTDGMGASDTDISLLFSDLSSAHEHLDALESAGMVSDTDRSSDYLDMIDQICDLYKRIRPDAATVLRTWNKSIFDASASWNVSEQWNSAESAGFFKKRGLKRQFMERAAPYLRDPSSSFETLTSTVNIIRDTSETVRRLRDMKQKAMTEGAEALKEQADRLQKLAAEIEENRSILNGLHLDREGFADVLGKVKSAQETLAKLIVAENDWNEQSDRVRSELMIDSTDRSPDGFVEFRNELEPGLENIMDWVNWNHYASRLTDLGIDGRVLDMIMSGTDRNIVIDSVYRSIYRLMIVSCRQRYESLLLFNATSFEEMIAEFKSLDARYTENNRRLLISKLSMNIPHNIENSVPDSELNILYRAVHAKKMRKSIRMLLSEIPNLLPRICPCLLMSPQSVAKYITLSFPKFDTVIFDESSQITTSKAISALGRAKSAVIAGDRNQLPPTSFFQKTIESFGDSEDDMTDMESFLDECLSLNMPGTYLKWHYRSRHESLITFSNRMFYDSTMLTFPSPNDQDARVSMRFVKGDYRRGKGSNRVEAEAIVDEIYRRTMDDELCSHSIGVIAFSVSQQNCINDILDDRMHDDTEFSERFSRLPDKLFIKNLETVQGDERDVILFSIGYGPDSSGTVYQNFGPINKQGGGRRLNVAVSRAREEMIVFSSIRYTDVKLTATSSSGVRSLKEFLKFAENDGHFSESDLTAPKKNDSAVMQQIQTFLAEQGYETRFGVGTSEFKVDIAVVNPDCPNEYLIGILADGESYRNSYNTRDREYARADVLRNLGWTVTHVWSMEWYTNRTNSEKRLLRDIQDARDRVTSCRIEPEVPVTEEETEEEEEWPLPPEEETIEMQPIVSSRKKIYDPAPTPVRYENPDLALGFPSIVRKIAESVIEHEGAVNEEHLLRSVSAVLNIKRLTSTKRETLTWIVRELKHEKENGFVTYWSPYVDSGTFDIYRVNADGSIRDLDYVPLPEILNAIEDVVFQCGSVSKDGCVSQVAHEFGYQRVAAKTRACLDTAVDIALAKGRVVLESGRLTSVSDGI